LGGTAGQASDAAHNVRPIGALDFVRLADVTVRWQADGNWCGVAALHLPPGNMEELDLRLPKGCELVQALVEDLPAAPKPIGDGVWRVALASSDLPRRVGVIFQGVMPEMDGAGRVRFESPTLGDLPVRQTFWTVFLPPSWTADRPEGAAAISGRPRDLPWPSSAAAIGGTQASGCYRSERGVTVLTLDCRQAPSSWPFHRWAAAATLLLSGIVSAGIFTKARRKAARK
jgi:hypothetical protein